MSMESQSRSSSMTAVGAFCGAFSVVMLNVARHRPISFQPWLHAGAGAAGAFLGARLAAIYDDSADALNRRHAARALLPSWAHAHLSPDDVGAELRDRRLAEAAGKFEALADAEERAFVGGLRAAGGAVTIGGAAALR